MFAGTRVPVQALIDYLEGGETIDDFVEGFPTVKREQVTAFLEEAMAKVTAKALRRAEREFDGSVGIRDRRYRAACAPESTRSCVSSFLNCYRLW